ncbi:hypothetical protein J5N97_001713 [Dioscorea zingiberensis]|uniref:PWWP domain-containing protein n=1 Tax=Dioscorea zingiberensis TaxID=325984 RepID=A0A9D5BVQ1_9LILI|nr:hypothetical protein J5N97_001713 [Dioscorea zingiberensis]
MVLLVCDSKVSKKKVGVYMDSRAHHSSQSSQLVGFKEGDLVWAKAFPYTWWPGYITRIMRSSVFVSFFGCDRVQCFDLLEIRGFEEAFPRISKMMRVKLSDEIDLALEELSRKATSGMMCYCRTLDLNQCVNENKGFKPKEMLGFVLDAAIDIQVGVFNLATAVRVSAQLGAYRHFVSACQYVDLSGGFDPDCVLDFVLRMAVSPSNFGEESHGFAEAVRQVNAYRHFVLVHPGWRYRQNLELEVDSLRNEFDWLEESSSSDISELSEDRSVSDICEGSEQEMLLCSSPGSAHGLNGQRENDLSWQMHEEDIDEGQQLLEGKEICMINRMDFSALDLSEDYQSLLNDQSETDGSSESVFFMYENNDHLTDGQSATVAAFCGTMLDESVDTESLLGHQSETFVESSMVFPDLSKDNKYVTGTVPEIVGGSSSSAGTDFYADYVNVQNSKSDNSPDSYVELATDDKSSLTRNVEKVAAFQSETFAESSMVSMLDENVDTESLLGHQSETFVESSMVFPDLSEVNKYVTGTVPEIVGGSRSSAGTDFYADKMNVQNSKSDNSADSYVELTTDDKSSLTRNVEEVAAFHLNEDMVCSNANRLLENISDVQNIDHVSPWSMSLTASEGENAKGQDENAADAKHIPNYMALLPLSSYHISLPKNTPCLERLPVFLANQCDAHSADSMLMSSVKSQSSDKLSLTVNYNIENQVNMMDVIPGSSSFIQTGTQDAFKTMKIDELDFSVNSYKLQRTLSPYTKDMADDNSLTADQRFASYKTHSSEATIDANQVDGNGPTLEGHTSNALKFHSGGVVCNRNMTKIDKMEVSCSLTSPVCVSRGISCRKKEQELPKFPSSSDWRRFYVSPLTPDVSNPGSEAKKPLVISKQRSFKSLHMKFPKDFKLPSTEVLEKKFAAFGALDHSRTKISFYTGAARVVFMHSADANVAYKYVSRKNIFGGANVHFWFDKYEKSRKGCRTECSTRIIEPSSSLPNPTISSTIVGSSSSSLIPVVSTVENSLQNLRSCLKRPNVLGGSALKPRSKVRFIIETS